MYGNRLIALEELLLKLLLNARDARNLGLLVGGVAHARDRAGDAQGKEVVPLTGGRKELAARKDANL